MSSSAKGYYYDGQTARAHTAEMHVNSNGELELSPALRPTAPFADIKISSRVGNTPRRIEFADGALFETLDHAQVDNWLANRGDSPGWIHRLESKTAYALSALFLVVVFITISATLGIPWSSKYIAQVLPASITVPLGDSAMESMDKLVFYPSKLSAERIAELQAQFKQLLPTEDTEYEYQLLFRGGGQIGPNAFALPNGTIIMTDELVGLADFDEELQAILLHEIGHLQYRHSLRQIIIHTSLAVLTTTLTGDITAAGSLVVGAPNVLMDASFSREMETEADTYSLQQMQRLGLDTTHFANIMERLEFAVFDDDSNPPADSSETDEDNDAQERWLNATKVLDFFSSHPLTEERIARFSQGIPAPLPQPVPIPDADANPYPIDGSTLRKLLATGQYAKLNKLFDDLHQSFLAGNNKTEIIAEKSYNFLTALSPQTFDHLQQWIAAMPESFAAHYALGVYHTQIVYIRRSGRYWRKIPEEDRDAMAAHTNNAVERLRRSLELQPNFTLAQTQLYSLASAGNYKDIDEEQFLADALDATPTSYTLNRTKLFYLQPRWGGDYREMRRALQTISDLAQQNPELAPLTGAFHHYKAFDAYSEKDYHRTIKLENVAISKGLKSWYFHRRAKAFNRLHDPEAALIDYNNAIRLYPEDPQLYVERSWIYFSLRQPEQVRKDIATTLSLAPYNTDALFGLAQWQSEEGDYASALNSYQKIVYAKPTEAKAHYLIGQLQFNHLNQADAALQATRKALDYSPRQTSYWHQYARIQSSMQSCGFMSTAEIYLALCKEKNCPTEHRQWVKSNHEALNKHTTCPKQ